MRSKIVFWIVALSLPIVSLASLLLFFSVNVPFSDDYDAILRYLLIPLPERFYHIFDFHNEHRIVTARVVFEGIYWVLGHFNFRVCMIIGSLFLLGYGLLFYIMFVGGDSVFKWYYVPCLWLIVSVLNNDNICWAMTSVSNVQTHFWAISAILFVANRKKIACSLMFVAGVLCGIAATFSTGCGMAVWGGLLFVLFHEWIIDKGSWTLVWKERHSISKIMGTECLIVFITCLICVCVYFIGLNNVVDQHQASFFNMVLFFLSFVGAIVPVFSISVIIGFVYCCLIIVLFLNLPRNTNKSAFAMLVYLLLCVCAATPFRSNDVCSALVGRYRIIPESIAVVIFLLLFPCVKKMISTEMHRRLTMVMSFLVATYLILFSFVSLPALQRRNFALIKSMASCPASVLEMWPEKGDWPNLLENANEKGIYNPHVVKRSISEGF